MMTIKDCIDMVDAIKPNQYTIKDKVSWLSFIDEIIINEVLKTHEGYDGRYDAFEGYSEDKLSQALIVPSPYDRVYTAYLKMKIDQENGEVARYNNSATLYNSYMAEFRKHYNKTHMPIDVTEARRVQKKPMASSGGMSEAEYENLVKDLTYILTEHFSDTISHDKLYDVVMEYAQNNVEMLRGKDGEKGEKGKGISDVSVYSYTEEAIILEVLFDDGSRRKVEIPRGKEGPKGDKGDKGDTPPIVQVINAESTETDIASARAIYLLTGDIDKALDEIIAIQQGLIDKSKIKCFFFGGTDVYTINFDIGMTWAEAIATNETTLVNQGFAVRDNGYVTCWIQNFIRKQEYEGETTEENIAEWGIKATDKIINGCVYVPSGVYDYED